MKFPAPAPRVAKGQLRCFQCRQAFLMKDGGWHDRGSQQVFLCRRCEHAPKASALKSPQALK